jgi:hypothetical protein
VTLSRRGLVRANSESVAEQHADNYTRFVILFYARTGSTVLAHALNSHPRILCFREVFNWLHGDSYVDFSVDRYDNNSADDGRLRRADPIAFLEKRIFCQHPQITSAVGFKLAYVHCDAQWGFPAVLDYLVPDKHIRIIHVQRRNMLKSLASDRLAAITGEYLRIRAFPGLSSIPKDLIHPARAFRRARVFVRQSLRQAHMPTRVALSVEECKAYFQGTRAAIARHEELFREHDKLSVFYEEILSSRDEVFARAQSFLGVEPRTLTVDLKKQNPDDLRALIENYDQLREAFAGTEYSEFFL